MKIDQIGIEFLKELEGVERKVYKDSAGLPTIGVGHLLLEDELSSGEIVINKTIVQYNRGLSMDEVDSLLAQDLESRTQFLNKLGLSLTQWQFDSILSFIYNIGNGAFSRSTLLKVLLNRKYEMVESEMRKWKYSGGQIVQGLINRREKEIRMWRGEYHYTAKDQGVNDKVEMSFQPIDESALMNTVELPDGTVTIQLIGRWRKK